MLTSSSAILRCLSIRLISASWPLSGPRSTITLLPSTMPSLISITRRSLPVKALSQATSSSFRGMNTSLLPSTLVKAGTRRNCSASFSASCVSTNKYPGAKRSVRLCHSSFQRRMVSKRRTKISPTKASSMKRRMSSSTLASWPLATCMAYMRMALSLSLSKPLHRNAAKSSHTAPPHCSALRAIAPHTTHTWIGSGA